MSLQKIHLRKLLRLFYADKALRTKILRADIRAHIKKESGLKKKKGGGDFHTSFWADAKRHVGGLQDLNETTENRIVLNDTRERLYPELRDGFLRWLNEERRQINQPIGVARDSLSIHHPIGELGTIVKIENLLTLVIGDHAHKVVYPYFSEHPILSEEAARIGLWVLGEAIKDFPAEELHVLDVIRGESFFNADTPLKGNEKKLFYNHYKMLVAEWDTLFNEY